MGHSTAGAPRPLKALSPAAVEQFRRDGFYHPVRALSPAEAHVLRAQLEAFERAEGKPLQGAYRHKSHLLFTWLWDLIFHPRILDAVEDVLGPNLLCWSTSFFIKEPHDPSFVSWHQDATYWGLNSPDVATAWVALSPSTIEAGAMRVVPGTHREQVSHRDTYDQNNLLTRGQEVMVDVDPSRAIDLVLAPGEMSLHHILIVHGSEPNQADDRRIGFAIRYVPTYVKQIVLVRGVDEYHHFDLETRPDGDMTPAAITRHQAVTERALKVLYRGTDRTEYRP
jgi:non-haem Fe2+, alpha-ketoglutarate-dependent halogenase